MHEKPLQTLQLQEGAYSTPHTPNWYLQPLLQNLHPSLTFGPQTSAIFTPTRVH